MEITWLARRDHKSITCLVFNNLTKRKSRQER
jgi:hypothetical protein